MKSVKLILSTLLISVLLIGCGSGNDETSGSDNNHSDYPDRDINGVIHWGEGGATDNVSRALAPLAEEALNTSIVMTNRAGGTASIGTQYVYDQNPDGYNLLFGAENPLLYQVLGISERDYLNDFYPVSISGQGMAAIVVNEDSEFETLEDVIDYTLENPGELTMGTTGEGGLPHVTSAMLSAELSTDFNNVPYDGEGPVITALLGNHVDISSVGVSAAMEYQKSGDIRMLALVHDEEHEMVPDVPALSSIYPEFEKYLPWGPFYGVFVHNETPDEIKETLSEGFESAQEDEEFKDLLASLGAETLNIYGDEAVEYMQQWQSVTTWLLDDGDATEYSPADFDIPEID